MSDFDIDFEAQCAEYEFIPPTQEALDRAHQEGGKPFAGTETGHLVRKSAFKKVRPAVKQLEKAIELLVRSDPTQLPRVAVGIARQMGGLSPITDAPEPFFLWTTQQYTLRQMFAGKYDAGKRTGSVSFYLIPDKDGKPRLAIKPATLWEALTLYAARMIATGTSVNTCEHCGTPFLSGGSGKIKKRGDARFCSSECRWKHHNEVRKKSKSRK